MENEKQSMAAQYHEILGCHVDCRLENSGRQLDFFTPVD